MAMLACVGMDFSKAPYPIIAMGFCMFDVPDLQWVFDFQIIAIPMVREMCADGNSILRVDIGVCHHRRS